MKQHKASMSKHHERKAREFGYNDEYADNIGRTQKKKMDGRKPVAKHTNKTRRKMVKPTVKGTYK